MRAHAESTILLVGAPVAQLDSASVFGTEGWGFESLRAYFRHLLLDKDLRRRHHSA